MGGEGLRGSTWRRRVLLLPALASVLVLAACAREPAGEITFSGPEPDELLNAEALADLVLEVAATEERTVDDLVLVHDGDEVGRSEGTQLLRWAPGELDDGEHTVVVERVVDADDAEPERTLLHTWSFQVDATLPEIDVTAPTTAVVAGEAVAITGTTEPAATVSAGDVEAVADEDGAFELELAEAEAGVVQLAAVDGAGNTAEASLELLTVPSRVAVDEMRGLHVTPHAWMHPGLRQGVLDLIAGGRINTVALTLKDEGGRIGYTSAVQLAVDSGANEGVYDLEETIAELHDLGVHVVGRIVAFRDPKVGPWARDNGHRDWLVHDTAGQLYTGRYECCFTNFAHPEVIEYNLAIAEEAAAAGIDGILWDYIRKPDGARDKLVYHGVEQEEPLEPHVVEFTRLAHERLAPYGVSHGASLYGIAADRPTQIAQDVPEMTKHLDFVSPMIYPSHWGPGEYGVADPNRQPYDIIAATLEVWEEAVAPGTRIAPWLEDTVYRAWDRPHQVREQIRAANDRGIDEWIMWDPNVRYTPSAYQ